MGAQASKEVGRRLPKNARAETLTSVPRESPSTLASARDPLATTDLKEDFFEEEVRDPLLHKNLTKLGPVKIEPTLTKMRPSDAMLGILHQRQLIEEAEERVADPSQLPDRIHIDDLYSIMEARKRSAPDEFDKPETLKALSAKYNLGEGTLKTLLNHYNNIAVMPPALDDKNGRRLAVWVNNKQEWKDAVEKSELRNEIYSKAKLAAMKDNAPSPELMQALKKQQPKQQTRVETPEEIREKKLRELFDD
ncbi:hypothetical protein F4703DRAFT_1834361 [Phycomyces blakesleeanus]